MNQIAEVFLDINRLYGLRKGDGSIQFEAVVDSELEGLISKLRSDYGLSPSVIREGVYVDCETLPSLSGVCVQIEISRGDLDGLPFRLYFDWNDLAAYKPNLQRVPEAFVVLSSEAKYIDGTCYGDDVSNYIKFVNFIAILIDMSDHKNLYNANLVGKIVFLQRSQLEIMLSVDFVDVIRPIDGISVVDSLMGDTSHYDQKKSILKEVLFTMLLNVPVVDRLEFLLDNFGEFSRRLSENYQLFVSEFSFDKVRVEYEERKREYVIKLNEVYNSLHGKMIGVPIALALASTSIVKVVGVASFFTNVLLFFAAAIYGLMMFFLLKNQWHSLESIKSEYDSYMSRLKYHYYDQYQMIESIRRDLDERYVYQKGSIYMYSVALFILAGVVGGYFLWCLPWDFLSKL